MTTILNIQGDEPTMRQMTWILEQEGYEVTNARETDGTTAQGVPDVIVINTNITAPEKRACIKALRALVPGVRILDLGPDAEGADHATGADQYLDKPFDADRLVAKVRALRPPEPARDLPLDVEPTAAAG